MAQDQDQPGQGQGNKKSSGVPVSAGSVMPNSSASGGVHVVLKTHVPPAGGYRAGYSDDNVHWSLGKS